MIIDASIASEWFLKEEDSLQADALLKRGLVFSAPALIRMEVSSAIAKAVRFYDLEAGSADRLNALWHARLNKGLVKLVHDDAIEHQAFSLAVKYQHPLQDCLYIALAQQQALPLLSADVKQSAIAEQYSIEVLELSEV